MFYPSWSLVSCMKMAFCSDHSFLSAPLAAILVMAFWEAPFRLQLGCLCPWTSVGFFSHTAVTSSVSGTLVCNFTSV